MTSFAHTCANFLVVALPIPLYAPIMTTTLFLIVDIVSDTLT